MNTFAIVPSSSDSDGFVELSRTKKGRLFEKHILSYGDLLYNGRKITIDDEFYQTLERNFKNNVCGIVQIPKVDDKNRHTEDPDRNIGEVIGLSQREGKIYAQLDARNEADADKLGKTLLGASALFHTDYLDTRTQERVGPTLVHVAVTNRPYVNELDDYQEILLSGMADGNDEAVLLTAAPKENTPMQLDDLLATLKADHNIDVPALQEAAGKVDKAVALTARIQQDLSDAGFIALSDTDDGLASAEELSSVIEEAGAQVVSLTAQVEEMQTATARKEAESKVQKLVDDAFILEDKFDAYVKLAMNDPETFEEIVPDSALVSLSDEQGSEQEEEDPDPTELEAEDEDVAVERITSYPGFNFASA